MSANLRNYTAQFVAIFITLTLWGASPKVGMTEQELLTMLGKPTSKLVGSHRSIYIWPDFRVEIGAGKVVHLERLHPISPLPLGAGERELMTQLVKFHEKAQEAISRDEYDKQLNTLTSRFRLGKGAFQNEEFAAAVRSYLNACVYVTRIWRSTKVDFSGNAFLWVEKSREPEAFQLVVEMPHDMKRNIRLVGSSAYRIDDISPVIAWVDDYYWNQLAKAFRNNLGEAPSTEIPANTDRSTSQSAIVGSNVRGLPKDIHSFEVLAKQSWQRTGVVIKRGEECRIEYLSGGWTANPSWGPVDARGNTKNVAGLTYILPGRTEGALVGRVGNGPPFFIGNSAITPHNSEGELFLVINDDPGGLKDNYGSVRVSISKSTDY